MTVIGIIFKEKREHIGIKEEEAAKQKAARQTAAER